jgi:hypothetical protein
MQHLDRLGCNGLCNVLGLHWVQMGVQSKLQQRGQLLQQGWMNRENALHGVSKHTKVEQVHTICAQVLGVSLEALELTLGLVQSHIATSRLLIGVSAWLPTLTCHACFAAGLEPHDTAAHLGAL